ncbi:MAG TPA: 4Fe-4S ferredoxin [candidate division Zixibacteria bacterium]|nr:4Fe-4S ferredoxin [candidate division Zixibacteria bacterium]
MAVRKIIRIDPEKCDGCGLCVHACAEGAIDLINGKARLISDTYCDGLGACIGDCPQNAITIIEREAAEFNEEAALSNAGSKKAVHRERKPIKVAPSVHSCPGSMSQTLQTFNPAKVAGQAKASQGGRPSRLANWPVQLMLAPIKAPYFDNANLVIAADCVPFACPDFHEKFLAGRTLLIGCPKLDDVQHYLDKLTRIFMQNRIKSIEIAYMEVPCCRGMVRLVETALDEAGVEIPVLLTRLDIKGNILEVSQFPCHQEIQK